MMWMFYKDIGSTLARLAERYAILATAGDGVRIPRVRRASARPDD